MKATNTMTIQIEGSGYISLEDMKDVITKAEQANPDYQVLGIYRYSDNELVFALAKRD